MIYGFADFELDGQRRTLRHKGEAVRVEAKPLDLLTYLVENRGRLVTKQELKEVVWRGAAVSRSTLPITVFAARRALGQDQGSGGPIATVGRQGYRFTAEVTIGADEPGRPPDHPNPFVGRGDVMSQLTRLLSESRAGHGHIGLLTGEAGIGKSRAARELAVLARAFGISATTGYSTDGGGAPAFWTWKPIITASLEALSERQVGALLKGGVPPELDRLFPELASHLARQPRLPPTNGAPGYHRVHETLARLVIGGPSARARLIILEDLHWADSASLELLLYLSTRIVEARLFVIGTLRDHDAVPGDARHELLHQLFRASVCHRIGLPPLTAADVAQFVARLTSEPDSSELAAAIYEKTQGNPFFIEETVRWLQSEAASGSGSSPRRIDPSRLPVPDAVRVVIRSRLRTVTKPTQDLLAVAAVIGAEFDTSLLRHAAQGEGPEQVSQLEEAAAARLVTPDRGGAPVTRFAHVLIRETIYQDLPAAQRGATHLRIAELLEGQAGPDPDRLLNELAFHFYRSLPSAADKAFAYCLRAARMAHSVFANQQACTLYQRALDAWAFQEESQRDHVRRCVALLGLGYCSLTAPRGSGGRLQVADAIRLARAIGRPDLLALGVVIANVYAVTGHPAVESIREVTEEALSLLPDGAPAVRAYLLSRIASDASIPIERRRALAVEAMALVCSPNDLGSFDDLIGPDLALMRVEAVRFCLGSLGPDDLGLCLQLATRAVRLADQGDLLCAWGALRARAKAHLTLGDMAAADEDIRRTRQLADRMHLSILDFETVAIEGYRAQMDGRFEDTQREIESLATAPWPITPSHRDFLIQLRTLVLSDERGVTSGRAIDQEFVDRAPMNLVRVYQFTKSAAEAIACRMLLRSNGREAASLFEAIVERGFDAIPRDDFFLTTLCDLTVVCCELDDRVRAAELYERMRPYVALCAVQIPLHFRGPVAHFLGLLASTLGHESVAIEHFEAAAAICARVGARPMLTRARLELANLLMGRNDSASRARAAFLIEEGLASARELGMASVCAALEKLRSRLETYGSRVLTARGA